MQNAEFVLFKKDFDLATKELMFLNFDEYENIKEQFRLSDYVEQRIVHELIVDELLESSFADVKALIEYFKVDENTFNILKESALNTRKLQ